MKITHPLLTKSLGLFGATMIRGLTATLDYRIVYEDPLADPIHPRRPRHAIYLLWHEYLMFPLDLRGKGLTLLISQHRDGELITQVMRHLGFRAVRGSSTRGGVHALRKMLRGRPKTARQGDKQTRRHGDTESRHGDTEKRGHGEEPKSDLRVSVSPRLRVGLSVSPCLDLEYWRLQVEQILNQVTGEAESWAESGRRKPGEMPIL